MNNTSNNSKAVVRHVRIVRPSTKGTDRLTIACKPEGQAN